MLAVAALMNEHRAIERVCDALVIFGESARDSEFDGRAELTRFILFIREFADRLHHRKEEDILFKEMVRAGLGEGRGAVARMLAEHDAVRHYITVLKDLAVQAHAWHARDRQMIDRSARAYVELLHGHIETEDTLVFPLAERTLPAAVQAEVDAACARFEAAEAAAIARMKALGEDLAASHVARSGTRYVERKVAVVRPAISATR